MVVAERQTDFNVHHRIIETEIYFKILQTHLNVKISGGPVQSVVCGMQHRRLRTDLQQKSVVEEKLHDIL